MGAQPVGNNFGGIEWEGGKIGEWGRPLKAGKEGMREGCVVLKTWW